MTVAEGTLWEALLGLETNLLLMTVAMRAGGRATRTGPWKKLNLYPKLLLHLANVLRKQELTKASIVSLEAVGFRRLEHLVHLDNPR